MKYQLFLEQLDNKLNDFCKKYKDYIYCKRGCAECCKCGDYPMSQLEFEYLMQGYIAVDDSLKQIIQKNIKAMQKGKVCPFLINDECSIYPYRPIVCRVHGFAYQGTKSVILPYCANTGKNFSQVYKNNAISIQPLSENLDTPNILKNIEYGEIRTLYDWLKPQSL